MSETEYFIYNIVCLLFKRNKELEGTSWATESSAVHSKATILLGI